MVAALRSALPLATEGTQECGNKNLKDLKR